MNKMEVTRMLQDVAKRINWYFVCCRRIQNSNYKLTLFEILQKAQSNHRWLSNENIYPKTDNYNKMKIHYEMYLLQFEKTKLKQVEKTEKLNSRNMQNVTYNEINVLLNDLNDIKNEIFNKDVDLGFEEFGNYYSSTARNLECYKYLLEMSCTIMPKEVCDIVTSINEKLANLKNYISKYNGNLVSEKEVYKRLLGVFEYFEKLEEYKDKIRTLKPIPASIVELVYNVYSQIHIMLKNSIDNKKITLSVYDCEIV